MADTPTWYAVIDKDGNLISTGTSVADAAALTAAGLTALTLSGDPAGQVWNATAKTFTAPPAKPAPSIIPVLTFVKRFTAAEYQAIRVSTDPQVALFMLELQFAPSGLIDLRNTDVVNGLAYLVSVGILTADRQTTIGTP